MEVIEIVIGQGRGSSGKARVEKKIKHKKLKDKKGILTSASTLEARDQWPDGKLYLILVGQSLLRAYFS